MLTGQFCLIDNKNDYYKIHLNIHKSDPLCTQKHNCMTTVGGWTGHLLFSDDKEFKSNALAAARVLVANAHEVEVLRHRGQGGHLSPVSVRNEVLLAFWLC
jgi:hypothetical protein